MKYGTWTVSSYEPADARALCAAGFSPITAALLCSRGYRDADAAREFLSCSYPLSSPFDLLDMDKAAARVRLALQRREHIAVFGDYDVDGITATCLLTDFLRRLGAEKVTSYIPGRMEEGYGLNEAAIRFLYHQQVNLIVTVDFTGAEVGTSTFKATVSYGDDFSQVGTLKTEPISAKIEKE